MKPVNIYITNQVWGRVWNTLRNTLDDKLWERIQVQNHIYVQSLKSYLGGVKTFKRYKISIRASKEQALLKIYHLLLFTIMFL